MTTLETQQFLTQLDRWPGPWDGVETGEIREAIRNFQQQYGLPVTGELTGEEAAKALVERSNT